MRAIVHIGMPKVGSTAIQSWLNLNRDALARQGIAYDPAQMPGYPKGVSHQGIAICQNHRLGRLAKNPVIQVNYQLFSLEDQAAFAEKFEAYFRDLLKQRDEDVFVISSEFIGARSSRPSHAQAMHDWLSQFFDDIRYLVYFRRQEDWITSSYSERLKRGVQQTLEEVIEASGEQNWFEIAELWAGVADEGQVDVRLLESDILVGGDLIADFATAIGADPEGLAPPDRRNQSLSGAAAEILRIANLQMPHKVEGGTKINPDKAALRRALLNSSLDLPRLTLSPEQLAHVREINRAANEQLRAKYFPDRDELFPARPATDYAPVRAEDVARLAVEMWTQNAGLQELMQLFEVELEH